MRTPLMIMLDAEEAWDRAAQASALSYYYGEMESPCQEMHMESEANEATLAKAEASMKVLCAELDALGLTPDGRQELLRYARWFALDLHVQFDMLWLIPNTTVPTCSWPHHRKVKVKRAPEPNFDPDDEDTPF
jgi:hypothetical protein